MKNFIFVLIIFVIFSCATHEVNKREDNIIIFENQSTITLREAIINPFMTRYEVWDDTFMIERRKDRFLSGKRYIAYEYFFYYGYENLITRFLLHDKVNEKKYYFDLYKEESSNEQFSDKINGKLQLIHEDKSVSDIMILKQVYNENKFNYDIYQDGVKVYNLSLSDDSDITGRNIKFLLNEVESDNTIVSIKRKNSFFLNEYMITINRDLLEYDDDYLLVSMLSLIDYNLKKSGVHFR